MDELPKGLQETMVRSRKRAFLILQASIAVVFMSFILAMQPLWPIHAWERLTSQT